MIDIINTLSNLDWAQVGFVITTITTILGVIGVVIERLGKKDYQGAIKAISDFLNPYIQQTPEQTEAAKEYLVGGSYMMTDSEYDRMCKELIESGAQFSERGMRHLVHVKEAEATAEYAIMVEDHDGNPQTECKHVFVSYGTPIVMSQTEVFKMACQRHAPITAVSN